MIKGWLVLAVLLAEMPGSATPATGVGGLSGGEAPLAPPVTLPDGEEFTSWEAAAGFSRTYHVDQKHPQASDENPGTPERPFRTINRAAQVLMPGERVVVAAGLYRERVAPARGGTDPLHMISYEAAPGAEVILSGSQVVTIGWTPSRRGEQTQIKSAWMTTLSAGMFEAENPFAELNLTDAQIDRCMDWAVPIKGKAPITLRRGLVFQDGQRLKQVPAYGDLAKGTGTYWVETNGLALHVRPRQDAHPGSATFEVTTRGFIFAPKVYGLGYIRVKGLTLEHSGNCFPRPQQGALSTQRGHHWIIESNVVRQCNAIGMDIGDQFDAAGPALAQGGRHIVRGNRVSDCGIGGIEGKQIERTLIEGNELRGCGWHDIWPLYETGGIKVHCTRSCVLRWNRVLGTTGAPGIWMDYDNINSRCTANVVVDADCSNGGIFMEASQRPNLVDNNFVWGTRGSGIYQHDCDELTIAHNLVAHSTDAAVRMQVCLGRKVGGRLTTAKRNRILNNVFIANGSVLAISDPDNISDRNVFAGSKKPFDLAAWQKEKGWDAHSLMATIEAVFKPATLDFSWRTDAALPLLPHVEGVGFDLLGRPRMGDKALPGPFAVSPPAPVRLEPPASAGRKIREISREDLLDHIHGGWVGMLIGGLEGLPHEMKYKDQPRDTLPEFSFLPDGARSDDDNDFEWTHLYFMDREGTLKIPYPRLVEIWKANMNQGIWVANRRARELMDQGVVPPETGSTARNPHAGYNLSGQFCVETYGLIAPGLPQAAAELGLHYARIAVSEEPLQAAQFWSTLISLLAFDEGPLDQTIRRALGAVDPTSAMSEVARDACQAWQDHPSDWKSARQAIHRKWMIGRHWNDNSTPLNGAMVILALLCGGGDFYPTLRYAMALGYDADCNAATAGAALGCRLGFKHVAALPQFQMPDRYLNKTRPQLPAECKVSAQAETLLRVCEQVILANGGERFEMAGRPAYRICLQEPRLLEPLPARRP